MYSCLYHISADCAFLCSRAKGLRSNNVCNKKYPTLFQIFVTFLRPFFLRKPGQHLPRRLQDEEGPARPDDPRGGGPELVQHRVQVRLGHAVRALDADAQRVEAGVEVIVAPWPASVPRSEKDDDITTNLSLCVCIPWFDQGVYRGVGV